MRQIERHGDRKKEAERVTQRDIYLERVYKSEKYLMTSPERKFDIQTCFEILLWQDKK